MQDIVAGDSQAQLRTGPAGTRYFEPGGVSFWDRRSLDVRGETAAAVAAQHVNAKGDNLLHQPSVSPMPLSPAPSSSQDCSKSVSPNSRSGPTTRPQSADSVMGR